MARVTEVLYPTAPNPTPSHPHPTLTRQLADLNPNRFALHDAVPHDHGDAIHGEGRRVSADAGAGIPGGRRASMRRPSALITPALALEIAERENPDDELEVERVSNLQADHFLGAKNSGKKKDEHLHRQKSTASERARSNSVKMAQQEAIEKLDSENVMDEEFDDEQEQQVIHSFTRSRAIANGMASPSCSS